MRKHEHRDCCAGIAPEGTERRNFLKLGALGGGVVLLGSMLPARESRAAEVEALLLSCMDYRLVDDHVRYMDGRKLTNNYDHIVLAGASLGAVTDKFPAWGKTFFEHLDVAIQLHHIKKVIILDHRDCGAYKVILDQDYSKDQTAELKVHGEQMRKLRDLIKAKHPALQVEMLLMDLDGRVEQIA